MIDCLRVFPLWKDRTIKFRDYTRSEEGGKDIKNVDRLVKIFFAVIGASAGYPLPMLHRRILPQYYRRPIHKTTQSAVPPPLPRKNK